MIHIIFVYHHLRIRTKKLDIMESRYVISQRGKALLKKYNKMLKDAQEFYEDVLTVHDASDEHENVTEKGIWVIMLQNLELEDGSKVITFEELEEWGMDREWNDGFITNCLKIA